MRCFTITNISEELYQTLLQSAQQHQRNMNHEILVRLHTSLEGAQPQPVMPSTAQFRAKSKTPVLPEKYLHAAIAEASSKV